MAAAKGSWSGTALTTLVVAMSEEGKVPPGRVFDKSLREYRTQAAHCNPRTSRAALSWADEYRRWGVEFARLLHISKESFDADREWLQKHPHPPYEAGFETQWLTWLAAHREWVRTRPPAYFSSAHWRSLRDKVEELREWALRNPPPHLEGAPAAEVTAPTLLAALLAWAEWIREDSEWHMAYLELRKGKPMLPLPPTGRASPLWEEERVGHEWLLAHPRPGDSPKKRTERVKHHPECEALWGRLIAMYG